RFHGHPDTFRQAATQDYSLPSTSFIADSHQVEPRPHPKGSVTAKMIMDEALTVPPQTWSEGLLAA
ncbi:hypothetical protein, partial [Pseudomonas avellanae]|uniref:hypothetical protein n=1 Tax=Pseudomonas avellanae TaxID=46257 RepID=UPI0019553B8E